MLSGLLILSITLLVLLAINYFTIRVFKLPEHKRERLRKIYLFIYGILMSFCGVAILIVDENPHVGWLYVLIGVGYPIVNWIVYRKKNL
jgi:hypothetical protein